MEKNSIKIFNIIICVITTVWGSVIAMDVSPKSVSPIGSASSRSASPITHSPDGSDHSHHSDSSITSKSSSSPKSTSSCSSLVTPVSSSSSVELAAKLSTVSLARRNSCDNFTVIEKVKLDQQYQEFKRLLTSTSGATDFIPTLDKAEKEKLYTSRLKALTLLKEQITKSQIDQDKKEVLIKQIIILEQYRTEKELGISPISSPIPHGKGPANYGKRDFKEDTEVFCSPQSLPFKSSAIERSSLRNSSDDSGH